METIAVVQMTSGKDLEANVAKMKRLFEDAVHRKARLVLFPEMAYLMGAPDEWRPHLAQYGALVSRFRAWARAANVWLLPGSLREPAGPEKFYNTLPVINPAGNVVSSYRKLFLFRATLPTRTYDETRHCVAGDSVVVEEICGIRMGLAICFDLRFPELFRALRRRGAQLVLLPAAFTATTGKAHWESLLRARAIENGMFVAASGQVGRSGEGGDTHGHSVIYSPWGERLAGLAEEEGVAIAPIDLAEITRCQEKVDAWGCRRDELRLD